MPILWIACCWLFTFSSFRCLSFNRLEDLYYYKRFPFKKLSLSKASISLYAICRENAPENTKETWWIFPLHYSQMFYESRMIYENVQSGISCSLNSMKHILDMILSFIINFNFSDNLINFLSSVSLISWSFYCLIIYVILFFSNSRRRIFWSSASSHKLILVCQLSTISDCCATFCSFIF